MIELTISIFPPPPLLLLPPLQIGFLTSNLVHCYTLFKKNQKIERETERERAWLVTGVGDGWAKGGAECGRFDGRTSWMRIQSGRPDHQRRLVGLLLMPIGVAITIVNLLFVIRRFRYGQTMQSGTAAAASAATPQRQRRLVGLVRRRLVLLLATSSTSATQSSPPANVAAVDGRSWTTLAGTIQHNGRHWSQRSQVERYEFRGASRSR